MQTTWVIVVPPGSLNITLTEVKAVIKQLKRHKAAGMDGIFNEILIFSGPSMWEAIWRLCSELFMLERIPVDWGRGVISPLHKSGDRSNPNNYRGITLLSVVGKVFTAVINKRISTWCEENGKLVEQQAGFRSKRSTVGQLFILNEVIQSSRVRKQRPTVAS